MSMGMKITGTKEVILNLKDLDKDIIEDVQSAINSGAKKVADRARANAPLGPTGNLKRAIKDKPMPIKLPQFPLVAIAVVDRNKKTGAPHAHLVEYGGRGGRMPAQPYLRPALDHSKSEIISGIDSALSKAVRRHA